MDRPWEHIDDLEGADIPKAVAAYCHVSLAHLMMQDRIYHGLFGDPRRIGILNEASGPVAKVIQDKVFDANALGICRLLDPARPSRRPSRNLTFALLIDTLPTSDNRQAYGAELQMLRDRARSLRDRRDKHLAHTDVDALRKGAQVGWVDPREIRAILLRMGDLLARIHQAEFQIHLIVWPPDDHHEIDFLRSLLLENDARKAVRTAFVQRFVDTPPQGALPQPEDDFPAWLRPRLEPD